MRIERKEDILFTEVVRCYDFANSPATENCESEELKELLAGLEHRKFFDEEEAWLLSELGYDSEIGLHRLPLVTLKCIKCGDTITCRVPCRVYRQQFADRTCGGCYHEYYLEPEGK